MTPPAIEIEMKLAASPEVLRRVARLRLLTGEAPPASRKLYSIYYDTPERDLWRLGVTLRLRRERVSAGAGSSPPASGVRWIQTVKSGDIARGGLAERLELECEVAGPSPEFGRIPSTPQTAFLTSPQIAARIQPLFATDFRRRAWLVAPAGETRLEVCIDRGWIRSGDRSEPISEIEVELKSGTAADVIEYARKLVAAAPLALENRSKAERGYALAAGDSYVPAGAQPAVLAPDMAVSVAFRAILGATLVHLQANERGTLEGRDPEFLHQMRVALRRMRSVLRVFAPVLPAAVFDRIIVELRWLARALGPARDWDVFVGETLGPVHREFAGHRGLAELYRRCVRARRAAWRRARRAMASRRYRELILDLAAVLVDDSWTRHMNDRQVATASGPATSFAANVLTERQARVRQHGRKLDTLSAARLHRLRIAMKKLRYAADAFAPLFDSGAARKLLRRLSRLQDILGSLNDATTVGHLLDACDGAPRTRALLEARGIVQGWGHARAEMQKARLGEEWKALRAVKKFW